MTVLVVEDDATKRDEIVDFIVSTGVEARSIRTASNMAEFVAKFDKSVAVCVIDLRIPAYENAEPLTNGIGVLQAVDQAGKGQVKILAISGYPEEFAKIRPQFESRGCLLVDFKEKTVWQAVLRQMIVQCRSAEKMEFLIFCALRSERAPYTGMPDLNGSPVREGSLSRYDIVLQGRRGTVLELPRMGLVDAAATAGAYIQKFSPSVVAMSGICAGFAGRAKLGQLLVSELAYEYQSGKWTSDGFSQEPYQVPISQNLRNILRDLLGQSNLLETLETGWHSKRPSEMSAPTFATFTSGSAVIASEQYMAQVSQFHRRVAGLDMEVYGLHRAAHLAQSEPDVICAKTVVDLTRTLAPGETKSLRRLLLQSEPTTQRLRLSPK